MSCKHKCCRHHTIQHGRRQLATAALGIIGAAYRLGLPEDIQGELLEPLARAREVHEAILDGSAGEVEKLVASRAPRPVHLDIMARILPREAGEGAA